MDGGRLRAEALPVAMDLFDELGEAFGARGAKPALDSDRRRGDGTPGPEELSGDAEEPDAAVAGGLAGWLATLARPGRCVASAARSAPAPCWVAWMGRDAARAAVPRARTGRAIDATAAPAPAPARAA